MTARSIAELRRVVEAALDGGEFEAALRALQEAMALALRNSQQLKLLNLGSPQADELCQLVGRRYLEARAASGREDVSAGTGADAVQDIYIASGLYGGGGHTAVIGDFVRNSAGRRALLLVTNIYGSMNNIAPSILARTGLDASHILVCQEHSLAGKLGWLLDLLARHRPDRVYLFNHFQDCMAIAAIHPSLARRYYFVHHTNRNPCYGVFLPGVVHIDLMPVTYRICRHTLNIADNLYLPIVVEDQGCRNFASRNYKSHEPVTASCGSSVKFRLDHEPDYFEIIASVLSATGGRHIHIGELPQKHLERRDRALEQASVPAERFVHVVHVPSLWMALDAYGVDLYIGSVPIGGARASVEAMGSGTPTVWHSNSDDPYLHDVGMKYPGAHTFTTAEELIELIGGIDEEWLRRQSVMARNRYEHVHHPARLAARLRGKEITDTLSGPNSGFLARSVSLLRGMFPSAAVQRELSSSGVSARDDTIGVSAGIAMEDLDDLLELQPVASDPGKG